MSILYIKSQSASEVYPQVVLIDSNKAVGPETPRLGPRFHIRSREDAIEQAHPALQRADVAPERAPGHDPRTLVQSSVSPFPEEGRQQAARPPPAPQALQTAHHARVQDSRRGSHQDGPGNDNNNRIRTR